MLYSLLLSLALLLGATPAAANENVNRHNGLWTTLLKAGVTLQINPRECDATVAGFYVVEDGRPRIAVCQDKRKRGSTAVVAWTENDLDTLRHESWHLVQDCRDGVVDMMVPDISSSRLNAIIDQYGADKAFWVWQKYHARDLYTEGIFQEIEAFYAASSYHPDYIAARIKDNCPLK